MNFTAEELALLNDGLAGYIHEDIRGHWRYWRQKDPYYIKLLEEAEALLKRIQTEITTLDPTITFTPNPQETPKS